MNEEDRKAARHLWQAYNAMETTKQRHFELLSLLENKKKNFNLNPTPEDTALLEQLLRDHDDQVKAFAAESTRLKSSNASAHRAMFEYIGQINDVLSGVREAH